MFESDRTVKAAFLVVGVIIGLFLYPALSSPQTTSYNLPTAVEESNCAGFSAGFEPSCQEAVEMARAEEGGEVASVGMIDDPPSWLITLTVNGDERHVQIPITESEVQQAIDTICSQEEFQQYDDPDQYVTCEEAVRTVSQTYDRILSFSITETEGETSWTIEVQDGDSEAVVVIPVEEEG